MTDEKRERPAVRAERSQKIQRAGGIKGDSTPPPAYFYRCGYATGTLDRWYSHRDRVNGWRERRGAA